MAKRELNISSVVSMKKSAGTLGDIPTKFLHEQPYDTILQAELLQRNSSGSDFNLDNKRQDWNWWLREPVAGLSRTPYSWRCWLFVLA